MSFGHCFKSSLLNADDIKHRHILVVIKSYHHFTGIRMDFDIWLFESQPWVPARYPKPWLGSMDVYSPRYGNNRSCPIPIYCCFLLKTLNGAVDTLSRFIKYQVIIELFAFFSPPARWGSLDFNQGATPSPSPPPPLCCLDLPCQLRMLWATHGPEYMPKRMPDIIADRINAGKNVRSDAR